MTANVEARGERRNAPDRESGGSQHAGNSAPPAILPLDCSEAEVHDALWANA
jgi:hypothetical protein